MQLAVPLNKFDANNIYFSEKKRNVVIDGDFIKIMYSDKNVEMNELYILCMVHQGDNKEDGFVLMKRPSGLKKPGKCIFEFDTSCERNSEIVSKLCAAETDILNRYIHSKSLTKTAVYSLRMQLLNGVIKAQDDLPELGKNAYILKISGLWETDTNVGITLKFICAKSVF